MPTSSQRIVALNPQPILILTSASYTSATEKSTEPLQTIHTHGKKEQSLLNTKSTTSNIFMDKLERLPTQKR